MKILKNSLLCCLLLIVFTSCNKDDDATTEMGLDGQISARIDGESFTSEAFDGAVEASFSEVDLGDTKYFVMAIGGADLSSNSLRAVGIAFGGFDFSNVTAGSEFKGISNEEGNPFALGTYQLERDIDEINASSENTSSATIRITAINREQRLISGEFSFTATDEETNESYNVTNGVFTNIPYND